MPNHPDGLSELLLLLPSMSLRTIHNSLKPTAIHATIPTFKYTAKVDLTSALQQVIDRLEIVIKTHSFLVIRKYINKYEITYI